MLAFSQNISVVIANTSVHKRVQPILPFPQNMQLLLKYTVTVLIILVLYICFNVFLIYMSLEKPPNNMIIKIIIMLMILLMMIIFEEDFVGNID